MRDARGAGFTLALAAGGTGGHILPAIAFGDWVSREKPEVRVDYMSGSRPLELEIYASSGINPFAMRASGSPAGAPFARSVARWGEMIASFRQARSFLKETSPDLCIMFGGYVSLPVMLAARSRKIRSVLHEQNALAGRVTKLADRIRVPIASGWDECEGLEPGHYAKVGVPIRRFRAMSRQEAHSILGTGGDGIGPVASVMTGSLGSGSLSEVLAELAKMEVFLTWTFFAIDPRVDAPQRAGANVTRLPKMWDISPVYAVSDILVTRCGASTLAEIEALGIPAVAVPWRGAADDHQMKNARLAAASEKILIWDELNDTLADLAEKIQNLYAVYCDSKSSKGNMLYNAGETCEKNCRLLWDFADSFRKGEVELEGRSLH